VAVVGRELEASAMEPIVNEPPGGTAVVELL